MKRLLGKLSFVVIITTLLLTFAFTSFASSTYWEFQDANFKRLGTITSSRKVDGLNLIATRAKPMSIKSNKQELNGTTYTHALSLGGQGNTTYRSVKVPVNGASTIEVVLRSTGSNSRKLVVADSKGEQLTTLNAGTSISKQEYNYTGDSGYIYLYSTNSNINIYEIKVTESDTESNTDMEVEIDEEIDEDIDLPSSNITLDDMPESLKESVEWVYYNRMVDEGTPEWTNLIFDQIYAGNGTLNYVVRWQSSKNVTLQQRKDIEAMIKREINNWTDALIGYDGWPYGEIDVKVVGWACADASQILDKQDDEIVYTDYIIDELSKEDPLIPAKLPYAPSELSRFENYTDSNYTYPGGLDKRFDMYLWGTENFYGGAGGDWGQRVSDDYILSTLESDDAHIIAHEIGHGFGLPDFYEDYQRPPEGFPVPTIMWAGNSITVTEWDIWLLRYTWSQIKQDTSRFPQ